MKPKLISKLQRLGEKVEPLRQFVANAPGQAARLRESITVTAGQLARLRAEIQSGITELRADTPELLLAALRELQDARGVLGQAGFEILGVDYELGLGPAQRLQVHLRRTGDAPPEMLAALASANPGHPVLRATLGALRRALEFSRTVEVPGLDFSRLALTVGPTPTIRMAWRTPDGGMVEPLDAPAPSNQPPPSTTTPAPPILPAPPSHPPAGPPKPESVLTSLKPSPAPIPANRPVPAASADPSPASSLSPPPPAGRPGITPAKTLGKDWRTTALDRFKKMPTPGSGA